MPAKTNIKSRASTRLNVTRTWYTGTHGVLDSVKIVVVDHTSPKKGTSIYAFGNGGTFYTPKSKETNIDDFIAEYKIKRCLVSSDDFGQVQGWAKLYGSLQILEDEEGPHGVFDGWRMAEQDKPIRIVGPAGRNRHSVIYNFWGHLQKQYPGTYLFDEEDSDEFATFPA